MEDKTLCTRGYWTIGRKKYKLALPGAPLRPRVTLWIDSQSKLAHSDCSSCVHTPFHPLGQRYPLRDDVRQYPVGPVTMGKKANSRLNLSCNAPATYIVGKQSSADA